MDYGVLEVEIAGHLNIHLNKGVDIEEEKVDCQAIPEAEIDYKKHYIKNKVTVAFSEEKADPTNSTFAIGQAVTVTFSILIESKLLRSAKGIYPLAERIKKILVGFRPTDCAKMWYTTQQFVDNERDIFKHVLEFQTKTFRVEDMDEKEPGEHDFKDLIINEEL